MEKFKKVMSKIFLWILFTLYLAILFYFLFFCESLSRKAGTTYRYNFIPFKEIKRYIVHFWQIGFYSAGLNLFGNIMCFAPFGFFIPVLSEKSKIFIRVFIFSMLFSTCIELLQLVSKVGSCDVDDVILNTLGGIIGYIIFKSVHSVTKKKK